MTSFDLADEDATRAIARRVAGVARAGDVIALWGGLGVGKTVFARAFIHARGLVGIEVPSPTFTLVQVYEAREPFAGTIFHFDLYRIDVPEDVLELDFEEALIAGILLIEWPERLGPLLPAERLDVLLADAADPAARRLTLTGYGAWPRRLAQAGLAGAGVAEAGAID